MNKPPRPHTLDLSKVDLGELDASVDKNFLEYAIPLPILEAVKQKNSSAIVGPKGSGKTGIRLKLSAELTAQGAINLAEADGFELKELHTSNPNVIKQKIEAYIIGLIFNWLCVHKK